MYFFTDVTAIYPYQVTVFLLVFVCKQINKKPYLLTPNKTLCPPSQHVSKVTAPSTSSTSYLSISGGFDVGVALLADDVVDVVQTVGGDVGKGLGTV